MKIYIVEFTPMYPVPSCLVIQAETIEDAGAIAASTILHTDEFTVKEHISTEAGVIVYESGDY